MERKHPYPKPIYPHDAQASVPVMQCENCTGRFTPKHNQQRYCSKKCRQRTGDLARSSTKGANSAVPISCAQCEDLIDRFHTRRGPKARYCSQRCRNKAYRWKKQVESNPEWNPPENGQVHGHGGAGEGAVATKHRTNGRKAGIQRQTGKCINESCDKLLTGRKDKCWCDQSCKRAWKRQNWLTLGISPTNRKISAVCAGCRKPMYGINQQRRYCSDSCRRHADAKRNRDTKPDGAPVCDRCKKSMTGKEDQSTRKGRYPKYCSNTCRMGAYRERRRVTDTGDVKT